MRKMTELLRFVSCLAPHERYSRPRTHSGLCTEIPCAMVGYAPVGGEWSGKGMKGSALRVGG